ncbi:PIG-L family deacetylase [Streptomyces sp. ID05-04B]|uniref:PIG-L deacetylase family protein n=1 Tax=unclassified Streptomyces TaxID=2593676 RepID=UPI000D19B167|nr:MULTISPECIES: PIG-L family deacetylase [unclassified Streptomyces]AVV45723.1 PIG-L family deacetylase [Streptomyces sp. P3]MDX5563271.1 PIG-L family deacetylase [Streptomyces sp. ID05-04B]
MRADPLTAAIGTGTPLVVLSPHLDDAVLSCGALMSHAVGHTQVRVATFFTEPGAPPYTVSGRQYLRQVGQPDAERLYRDRRAEDREVLRRLGVDWLHLGLVDGLFRRRAAASGGGRGRLRRVLPEAAHVYPTYRLHLATGRISRHDAATVSRVLALLEELASPPRTVLLAPSGVGGHVDHVLVRTAAELSGAPVVYYSDFPYNQRNGLDPRFVERNALVEVEWARELAAKPALVRGYRSQADALFPGGRIPLVPETYMLTDGERTGDGGVGGSPWPS